MRNASRIGMLIAAVAVTAAAAAGTAAAGTAAAGAHAAATARPKLHHLGLAPVLPITLTPAGFTIPGDNPRPGGLVTFSVSAPGSLSYYWTSFKLENGITLAQVAQWLSQAESPDKTVALAAVRDLYSNVDFTGGLAVNGNSTLGLTVDLTAGTYYFTAAPAEPTSGASMSRNSVRGEIAAMARALATRAPARALATSAPSPLQILQVTDPASAALPPPFSAALVLREVNGQARYFRIGRFYGQGAFLLRNDTTQPQEANFEQVVPGTTNDQIQDYFDAVLAGTTLPPSPFLAVVGGELLLSPGHTVIVQTTFSPGWYSALSFPTDENTGVKQAYNGTHIVLVMR